MSHRTILVVDPDPTTRQRAVALLQGAGYCVTGTGKYSDAKHCIISTPPQLVLTDVRLGAFNGLQLIVRGRINRPDMAAILTDQSLDRVLEVEAGCQHAVYLPKPFSPEVLLDMVERSFIARPVGST